MNGLHRAGKEQSNHWVNLKIFATLTLMPITVCQRGGLNNLHASVALPTSFSTDLTNSKYGSSSVDEVSMQAFMKKRAEARVLWGRAYAAKYQIEGTPLSVEHRRGAHPDDDAAFVAGASPRVNTLIHYGDGSRVLIYETGDPDFLYLEICVPVMKTIGAQRCDSQMLDRLINKHCMQAAPIKCSW